MAAPGLDTFIGEANELLETISRKILNMEDASDDDELINDIFRTAHTLKGSSGIFELTGIQNTTHTLESLLDALRHHEIEFDPVMVDVLLDGFDRVKEMVEVLEEGGDHTEVDVADVVEQVEALLPAKDEEEFEEIHIAERTADDWLISESRRAAFESADRGGDPLYGFTMNLEDSIFNFGIDPLRLFDAILSLGRVLYQEVDASAVPPLTELDPYSYYCRLSALIALPASAHEQFIEEFDMVAELGEVWFFRADAASGSGGETGEAIDGVEIALGPVHEDFLDECDALLAESGSLDGSAWRERLEALADSLPAFLSLTNPEAIIHRHASDMAQYIERQSNGSADGVKMATEVLGRFTVAIRQQTPVTVVTDTSQTTAADPALSSSVESAGAANPPGSPASAAGGGGSSSPPVVAETPEEHAIHAAAVEEGRQCLLNITRVGELSGSNTLFLQAIKKRVKRIDRTMAVACAALGVDSAELHAASAKLIALDDDTPAAISGSAIHSVHEKITELVNRMTASATVAPVAAAKVEKRASADRRQSSRRGDEEASAKPKRRARKEAVFGQTIKIEQAHLDQLMEMVGEMVVAKNALPYFERELATRFGVPEAAAELRERSAVIARISDDLQNLAMRMRMLPVSHAFSRFPRLVRDTARKLDKQLALQMSGDTVLLDKTMIEAIVDPLIHLVRNSMDHGIEGPEEREAVGKPATGSINLDAWQEGNSVHIRIRDDGRGIDPDKMRIVGVNKGLIDHEEASSMSDEEAQNLIFRAGFSSVEKITDLSGRGVGMDVVARAIAEVKGVVKMTSTVGKGTDITLILPLSLAITKVLVVHQDGQVYGIPAQDVVESISLRVDQIAHSGGRPVITHRNSVLPLFDLGACFAQRDTVLTDSGKELRVAVLQLGDMRVGLIVERIERDMDIMIKPLPASLQDLPHITGGSILGDGRLLFILETSVLLS
ncbi:MAG: chemotaxis protein CheA [Mariprofundales bacterium]|nr:chemotaxis protein CheA [Mariprofundales bacterium]